MKEKIKAKLFIFYLLIFLAYIGMLVAFWIKKEIIVYILGAILLTFLLLVKRLVVGKDIKTDESKANSESRVFLTLMISIFTVISREHWIGILLTSIALGLLLWQDFMASV